MKNLRGEKYEKNNSCSFSIAVSGQFTSCCNGSRRQNRRLKRISEAKPDTKVLSPTARLGKQAAERKRVADFRKTQTEKANTVPQTVVSEKPKMTEITAPVGSQERRKQLIEVQKQRIKASREKRLASAGVLATY